MEKTVEEYTEMFKHLTPVPKEFCGAVSNTLPCVCNDTGYIELKHPPGKLVSCGYCNSKESFK